MDGRTLRDVFLAVAPPHTDTVNNIALLGLVSETTSLVGARGARCPVDDVQLTVLPAAILRVGQCLTIRRQKLNTPNAEQETEDIRLLLFVQLANIFVGTHVAGC